MRRNSSLTAFVTLGLVAGVGVGRSAQPRPNVLVAIADDLGWVDLGCYGSTFHETPHLDRLASEAVRFTGAYSAGAVCSPTRSSIMSGKFPARTGVTDYIPGLRPTNRNLLTHPTRMELPLEEFTIAEALKEAGYQTFYSGKWHLGGEGYGPEKQGFEQVVAEADLGDKGRDPTVGVRITDSALRFLDTRDAKRPFFVCLGYHEPHTPILAYDRHIDRFRAKASEMKHAGPTEAVERNGKSRLVQNDPAYASEVAGLDDQVGRVLDALRDRKLESATIVVFVSDNGGLATVQNAGPTTNLPLRSGKGWLYEGGIRIPLLIKVPGITKGGSTCDVPVITTDLYPTLLDLLGLPPRPAQHVDGMSIASLLKGGARLDRSTFFWHYPHYHGSTWAPGAAIRDGDWKLIEFHDESKTELYDLTNDLGEVHDLAESQPAKLRELKDKLAAWQRDVGAKMPTPNPKVSSKP